MNGQKTYVHIHNTILFIGENKQTQSEEEDSRKVKGQMWADTIMDLDVCVHSVHTALTIILYSIFYCAFIYFGTVHEVKCGNTYDIISALEVSNSWPFLLEISAYINLFHTYKNKGSIIITNLHVRPLRHAQNINKSNGFWIRDPF